MKKLVLVLLAVGLAGLGSTPALAGFNIGASYIDASVEVDEPSFDFDADNSNFKVFAGWRFFKWLGVEVQYVNLGEFDDRVIVPPSTSPVKVEIDVTTLDVFAVVGFQFWRIDIFGKGGISFSDAEIKGSGISEDESESDFAYGVGAAIRITQRLWIRGEYEIYEIDDEADIDVVSLGVDIRFGGN